MGFQPAIGEQLVKFRARHRLASGGLRESFTATVIGQVSEHVAEPHERLDSVCLGAADQRIEHGRVAASPLAADE